jgi:hypothetical protein
MGNQVYANNLEVSCKAANGKSICAFPDVCFTPPQTPATPPGVPVPYPNTGMASDCTDGSSTVKISGQEAMLRNKSYFKTSSGDEAGCAPKKGVITSQIKGKVYFIGWSMDIKIEGENVVRHLDMTTGNHGSNPNSLMTAHIDEMISAQVAECKEAKKDAGEKCKGKTPDKCDDKCKEAQKCQLVPYKNAEKACCKDASTGDHIVEASGFYNRGRGGNRSKALKGCKGYDAQAAPCCCVKGGAYSNEHGRMSALRGYGAHQCPEETLSLDGRGRVRSRATTYGAAKKRAAHVLCRVFPQCKEHCILDQFKAFDEEHGLDDNTKIRATTYGDPDKWSGRLKIKDLLQKLKGTISGGGGGK